MLSECTFYYLLVLNRGRSQNPSWTHHRIIHPQCWRNSRTPPSASDGWKCTEVVGVSLSAHLNRCYPSTSQSPPSGPFSTVSVSMVPTAAGILLFFFPVLMLSWELGQCLTVWMHFKVSCLNLASVKRAKTVVLCQPCRKIIVGLRRTAGTERGQRQLLC